MSPRDVVPPNFASADPSHALYAGRTKYGAAPAQGVASARGYVPGRGPMWKTYFVMKRSSVEVAAGVPKSR